jgi:hypothetical protein
MELTFARMNYDPQPSLARCVSRRPTAAFMFLHTIAKLKHMKKNIVGI